MRPWWVCICSMDEYDNNESSVRYIFTLAKLVWSFWLDCLFAGRFDCVLCILWLNCNSLIDITFIFGWTILKCSNSNFVHVYGAVSQFIWTSILFLPLFFFLEWTSGRRPGQGYWPIWSSGVNVRVWHQLNWIKEHHGWMDCVRCN